jgi:hypothetical protein
MKLYKYRFWFEKFDKEELECKETNKCYISNRDRISKDTIGVINSYNQLYLLESNDLLAYEIFKKNKIDKLNRQLEDVNSLIKRANKLGVTNDLELVIK